MTNKTPFKSQLFVAEAENISGVFDEGRKPGLILIALGRHASHNAFFRSWGARLALFERQKLQKHQT